MAEVLRTDIFQRAIPWSRLILNSKRKINDLNVASGEKIRAVLAGLWLASVLILPLAVAFPALGGVAGLISLVVAAANWPLVTFFVRDRGVLFAIQAVLYHQIYYCYSATVYAACWMERHILGKTYKASDETSATTAGVRSPLATMSVLNDAKDDGDI